MQQKRILILLGHPDKSGLGGTLADAYEAGAREAGHHVDRINLGEIQFDPILHQGYRAIQELEPDLVRFKDLITACDHFVILHPIWWTGMPGLLKGFFDRVWLPGSAFRYIKTKAGKRTLFWHRLFRGKTARIILTSGTPKWMVMALPGNANAQLRWGILWFAGFSVRSTWFGSAENVPDARKQRLMEKVRSLGQRGI